MPREDTVPIVTQENSEEGQLSQNCDDTHRRGNEGEKPLEEGKQYHIFISYSSSDRDYVLCLKNHLEDLGFKCMMSEHDFTPGRPIMQNIESFMKICQKILFVVTTSFLEKTYCDLEVDMAHTYAADHHINNFIMVLLREKCELPLRIKYLTYIDGISTEPQDVARRVEDAFTHQDVMLPNTQHDGMESGKVILTKYPEQQLSRLCCSPSYQFNDLTEIELNKLKSSSIQESAKLYREMVQNINNTFFLKRLFMCKPEGTQKCVVLLTLTTLAITALSVFGLLLVARPIEYNDTFLILISIPVVVPIMIWIFALSLPFCFSNRAVHDSLSILQKEIDFKSQKYLVFYTNHYPSCIKFVYYNMKPCWDYMEERVRKQWPEASDDEIVKTCKEELFKSVRHLCLQSLPTAKVLRHKTHNYRVCLCQFSQADWAQKPSRASTNECQATDTDIGEETCVLQVVENEEDSELHTITTGNLITENLHGIDNINFEVTDDGDETHVKMAQSEPRPRLGTRRVEVDITLSGGETLNLNDIQLSPPLTSTGESTNQISQDDELCFRGEKHIDEETYAKTCV